MIDLTAFNKRSYKIETSHDRISVIQDGLIRRGGLILSLHCFKCRSVTFTVTMVEDVLRESDGEIIISSEAKKAISKKSAQLFKEYLRRGLNDS